MRSAATLSAGVQRLESPAAAHVERRERRVMKVVVLGAAGQLGAAVAREFAHAGAAVLALTHRDVDITSAGATSALARLEPDVFVNCAAWNDVDRAEDEPDAADAVNHVGVEHVAAAACASGAVLVHYSTDFVFDGRASRPYDEAAPPAPLNSYGASKLAGEQAAASAPLHYVLRLSSVFGGYPGEGAAGRVTIDRMAQAVRNGQPVRAFVDRTVTPSYTVDVARATRVLVSAAAAPGLYHCVNTGTTTWFELARHLADLLGTAAPIVPVSTTEVRTRAERPRFCALSNEKLEGAGITMPTWSHALRRYVATRLHTMIRRPPGNGGEYVATLYPNCHAVRADGLSGSAGVLGVAGTAGTDLDNEPEWVDAAGRGDPADGGRACPGDDHGARRHRVVGS